MNKRKKHKKYVQSRNTDRIEKTKKSNSEKFPLFNGIIETRKTQFIITEHCNHGEFAISNFVFKKIYNEMDPKLYCKSCRLEFIEKYNIEEGDKIFQKEKLGKIDPGSQTKSYIFRYYPILYKIIKEIMRERFCQWSEALYIFKNDIEESPICNNECCNIKTKFSNTAKVYNLYCEEHANNVFSKGQKELSDWLSEIVEIHENRRNLIKSGEIDIFIPEKNVGIEFNGLYYHSDIFKEKEYHYNKYIKCRGANINLISVWEDDWNHKKNIVKSIILNKIGLSKTRIGGRKCSIGEVNAKDSLIFLNENHLQGNSAASIRIGLFYENKLISLMTFSKKRNILRSKSKMGEYEMTRFCNKINYNINGAATKLFQYFLKTYRPNNIISYANLDISNGNVYVKMGMRLIGHTGINYWWAKSEKKFHRSHFMKYKLKKNEVYSDIKTGEEIMKDMGYFKIYGAGNLKYEYNGD